MLFVKIIYGYVNKFKYIWYRDLKINLLFDIKSKF